MSTKLGRTSLPEVRFNLSMCTLTSCQVWHTGIPESLWDVTNMATSHNLTLRATYLWGWLLAGCETWHVCTRRHEHTVQIHIYLFLSILPFSNPWKTMGGGIESVKKWLLFNMPVSTVSTNPTTSRRASCQFKYILFFLITILHPSTIIKKYLRCCSMLRCVHTATNHLPYKVYVNSWSRWLPVVWTNFFKQT